MKTVITIVSPSYSGSSLLNLLLDSVDGVRGVGEAVHYHRKFDWPAHCCQCECPASECVTTPRVDADRFYGSLFDLYPDADVIVDSSKSMLYMLERPPEPQFRYLVLELVRDQVSILKSMLRHHPDRSAAQSNELYWQVWQDHVALIREHRWPSREVRYRLLCEDADRTLRGICEWAGVECRRRQNWWETDTHIIGGNWMVACQVQGREQFFGDGKYAGNYHRVFCDE